MAGMIMPKPVAASTATHTGASAKVTPAKATEQAMHMGGGCGGAMGGVTQLGGGGGADMSSIAAMLTSITQALGTLAQAIQGLVAGGGPGQTAVKGASGTISVAATSTASATPIKSAVVQQSGSVEQTSFEQQVAQLINQQRAQHGLRPVKYSAALDAAATNHNVQQVNTRTMAHVNIGDSDPGSRIRAQGWRGAWGENVAVGQKSPQQVVTEWMNSPEHRANILNPHYAFMGVSYKTTADGHPFWAQEFGG